MNIEEIKVREQKATPGPWTMSNEPQGSGFFGTIHGNAGVSFSGNRADNEFIAHARTDIPVLIADVERLTAENDVLKSECKAHVRKQTDLFKGYQRIKADNATLTRALEIASSEVDVAFETLASHHVITWAHKACNDQDNIDVWIQKAKQAQEQEGKECQK